MSQVTVMVFCREGGADSIEPTGGTLPVRASQRMLTKCR